MSSHCFQAEKAKENEDLVSQKLNDTEKRYISICFHLICLSSLRYVFMVCVIDVKVDEFNGFFVLNFLIALLYQDIKLESSFMVCFSLKNGCMNVKYPG